jgi:hypothetical protein
VPADKLEATLLETRTASPDKWYRVAGMAAGVGLFAWFIVLVRNGLMAWFDGDDLMNLHYYWSRPWSALLKANLEFWSSYYRPGGGLFYRLIYAAWGFHPLPFRIAVLALLSVNFVLLAVVVWQLTKSRWGVLIALLLIGINPTFSAAYFDTGTIYDILAYAFFWAGFALYVHLRQAGRPLGWGALVLVFLLYAGALESKEIAVTFPVAVGLYELVWHPPATWKPSALGRWIWQEGRLAVIGSVAAIAYFLGKRYGPDSLWLLSSYRPQYSPAAYFRSLSTYFRELVYQPVHVNSVEFSTLLAAMVTLAAVTRRRCLLWGFGFIALGVLPLAFIPARGGFAYMVPAVGWAVYVAGLLDWLIEAFARRRVWLQRAAQAGLFIALFVVLAPWQQKWIGMHAHAALDMQGHDRHFIDQIRALIPSPRKSAHILLLTDAEGLDNYDVYFVIRLYYGDPTLQVHRMKVFRDYHEQPVLKSYDYLLDWKDGRFFLVNK